MLLRRTGNRLSPVRSDVPIVGHVGRRSWDHRQRPAAIVCIGCASPRQRGNPAARGQHGHRVIERTKPGCAGLRLHLHPRARPRRSQHGMVSAPR